MTTESSRLTYIANPDLRYNACEPGKSPCGVVHIALFYDEKHAPLAGGETHIPQALLDTMIDTFRTDAWDDQTYTSPQK